MINTQNFTKMGLLGSIEGSDLLVLAVLLLVAIINLFLIVRFLELVKVCKSLLTEIQLFRNQQHYQQTGDEHSLPYSELNGYKTPLSKEHIRVLKEGYRQCYAQPQGAHYGVGNQNQPQAEAQAGTNLPNTL